MARYMGSYRYVDRVLTWTTDNVYGPSAIPWNDKHASPKELTLDDIEKLKVGGMPCIPVERH